MIYPRPHTEYQVWNISMLWNFLPLKSKKLSETWIVMPNIVFTLFNSFGDCSFLPSTAVCHIKFLWITTNLKIVIQKIQRNWIWFVQNGSETAAEAYPSAIKFYWADPDQCSQQNGKSLFFQFLNYCRILL